MMAHLSEGGISVPFHETTPKLPLRGYFPKTETCRKTPRFSENTPLPPHAGTPRNAPRAFAKSVCKTSQGMEKSMREQLYI